MKAVGLMENGVVNLLSILPRIGLFLIWIPSWVLGSWEPIRLSSYPQKIRVFYSMNDPAVPAELGFKSVPLPVGENTAVIQASDRAIWIGTTKGVMRLDMTASIRDQREYYAGQRYLPDDHVLQMVSDDHGGIWVRTQTGVSHIERKAMTLARKADFFEERIRSRHDRYGLVAPSFLPRSGDLSGNRLVDNDNDGLWTAIYAAAECFRFAVTRSSEALANAQKSVAAMLFLEDIAGRRGFPARSFIRKGDPMPETGEWHWTRDGQYYWKADTSSDEIVGHFFLFGVAYDLLPDESLRRRIAETAGRIMDHILENDYNLIDLDGLPTRWGYWGPRRLIQEPDERALNSLELLSFLKTAAHVTGQARYESEYQKAAWDFEYADWITRLNEFRLELNYSDEELAMLSFYGIFQYEKDAHILNYYRQALEKWWENIRRQANPLWTFIYLLGRPDANADLSLAVQTLYRMPMDTIEWTVTNSHRQDLIWAGPPDRFGRRETLTLLPPDERPVMKWNGNPFIVDGGNDGLSEDDGAAFLLPYWMGRFHQFILEQ